MEYYNYILVPHILAGTIALTAGTTAFIAKKWSNAHKLAGKIFYFAMIGIAVTAILMSSIKWNPFLFCIAFFSMFLAQQGFRAIQFFQGESIKTYDKIIALIGISVGTIMAVLGSISLLSGINTFGILFLIFGAISAASGISFYRKLQLPPKRRQQWITTHISAIGGAYIATLTAFCTTAIRIEPDIVAWLLPTVVFSPILTRFRLKFTKQLKLK